MMVCWLVYFGSMTSVSLVLIYPLLECNMEVHDVHSTLTNKAFEPFSLQLVQVVVFGYQTESKNWIIELV